MMATAKTSASIHAETIEAIRDLNDIVYTLKNLKDRISPEPAKDGEEKAKEAYISLREFLETAPKSINYIKESCLGLIQEIEALLF